MKNRKYKSLIIFLVAIVGVFIDLSFTNSLTAKAGGLQPVTLNAKQMKKAGLIDRNIPKKFHGTWYWAEKIPGEMISFNPTKYAKNKINLHKAIINNHSIKYFSYGEAKNEVIGNTKYPLKYNKWNESKNISTSALRVNNHFTDSNFKSKSTPILPVYYDGYLSILTISKHNLRWNLLLDNNKIKKIISTKKIYRYHTYYKNINKAKKHASIY